MDVRIAARQNLEHTVEEAKRGLTHNTTNGFAEPLAVRGLCFAGRCFFFAFFSFVSMSQLSLNSARSHASHFHGVSGQSGRKFTRGMTSDSFGKKEALKAWSFSHVGIFGPKSHHGLVSLGELHPGQVFEASFSHLPGYLEATTPSPVSWHVISLAPAGLATAGAFPMPAEAEEDAPTLSASWPAKDGVQFLRFYEEQYNAERDDTRRTPQFIKAIQERIRGRDGVTVLDIGTGPFALFATVAARAGAKKVYAVEGNPEAADRARAFLLEQEDIPEGVIEVIDGFSTAVTLPEKVDLVLAELRPPSRTGSSKVREAPGPAADSEPPGPYIGVLEEIRFGEGELPAGRWEQKPLNFKVMEDRLRANYDQYFEALTTKEDTKADAARPLAKQTAESFSGMAIWPRLVLDPAGKIVVESRGLNGEHQKSHWPTLLALMSPTPVPVQSGDILKISESAELARDLLSPVKYSFKGELVRGPDEDSSYACLLSQQSYVKSLSRSLLMVVLASFDKITSIALCISLCTDKEFIELRESWEGVLVVQSIIILFLVYVLLWIFTARGRANAQVQADIDYVGDFVWPNGAPDMASATPRPEGDRLVNTDEDFVSGRIGSRGRLRGHGRPKIVPEHVRLFQLNAVALDFLEIADTFRLFAHGPRYVEGPCYILCPQVCADPAELDMAFSQLQLVEKLNNLQLDLELLVGEGGRDFLVASQSYLREAKSYAATLVFDGPRQQVSGIDWDEAYGTCVARVACSHWSVLVRRYMLSKSNESHIILSGVTFDESDPASASGSYIYPLPGTRPSKRSPQALGELSFPVLQSLATGGKAVRLLFGPGGKGGATGRLCDASLSPFIGDGDTDISWPRRWRLPPWGSKPVPTVMQMLEQIEAARMDLSHSFIAVRPTADGAWAQNFSCTGTDIYYDPSLCLEVLGYGGYVWSVNIHPPYKGELRIAGRRLGDVSQAAISKFIDPLRPYDSHHFDTVSIEHLFHRLDVLWRQSTEPAPDLFFLHPATHNCHAIEYLFSGAPLQPKILVVPINPLIPPPFEVLPRYEAWWHIMRPAWRNTRLAKGWVQHSVEDLADGFGDDAMDEYLTAALWMGQCSLAAVDSMLDRMSVKKFRYTLHHISSAYAVYVRKDIQTHLARPQASQQHPDSSFSSWLRGWHCATGSRYFSKLELDMGRLAAWLKGGSQADPAVPRREKEKIICYFLDRQSIPVQRRNFDCQAHLANRDSYSEVEAESCVRPDHRGWGNDPYVSETIQDSVGACEAHCRASACNYWTYDPTALYGQPLCWIWTGGRPAEIKSERGWISGDADCRRDELARQAQASKSADKTDEEDWQKVDEASEDQVLVGTMPGPGSSREVFKQWAVKQLDEIPGMKYFLESEKRGRCVKGFCECFPPHRGPLCEQVDAGTRDADRNFSAVLHYLTSDDDTDIEDIQHSLPRLWRRFNRRFDYPVVVFNDGLSEIHRQQIVNASRNRIWFAYVDDYLEIPSFILDDPSRKAALDDIKWSLGYRGMCRFRSGTIFLQPVLQNFQYAMTLDTDGYFPAEVSADPISAMHEGGYVYTWSHLLPDLPGAVRHFWEYSLMYMKMKGIDPRGTPILRQFVREEDVQWTYQLYMNDIEIVQLDWFRSDPYQDYFRYLDSIGVSSRKRCLIAGELPRPFGAYKSAWGSRRWQSSSEACPKKKGGDGQGQGSQRLEAEHSELLGTGIWRSNKAKGAAGKSASNLAMRISLTYMQLFSIPYLVTDVVQLCHPRKGAMRYAALSHRGKVPRVFALGYVNKVMFQFEETVGILTQLPNLALVKLPCMAMKVYMFVSLKRSVLVLVSALWDFLLFVVKVYMIIAHVETAVKFKSWLVASHPDASRAARTVREKLLKKHFFFHESPEKPGHLEDPGALGWIWLLFGRCQEEQRSPTGYLGRWTQISATLPSSPNWPASPTKPFMPGPGRSTSEMSLSGSWVEHSVPLKMARSILAPRPGEEVGRKTVFASGIPTISSKVVDGLSLVHPGTSSIDMSKYGVLSRSDGHSKWFLQKTLLEHDKSMDHPWMQMIYKQSFSLKQYAAWLALNHKVFQAMEAKFDLSVEPIRAVHDDALARTQKLEADLARLMGPEWSEEHPAKFGGALNLRSLSSDGQESAGICSASSAAKQYLKGFEVDAADPYLLLSHHFLQYNAVLSGGAYLGEMVSQKLCVPHGAPGVKFYHFEGVQPGKEPARVQEYLRAFDQLQIDEDVRRRMLQSMKRIYADTEAMMTEIFQMNPASGVSYKTSKEGSEAGELPAPCKEQLTLSLQDFSHTLSFRELREYTGEAEGRILIGLAGELLDVSSGREMYGPGGGYSVLAGHDVTRCLATMSLEPEHLDDLRWAPDCADDEEALTQWRQRLKEKYPVAGRAVSVILLPGVFAGTSMTVREGMPRALL
eukprot:s470_g19.t2